MTHGQMTMLSLFNEYDVKGSLSGKYKIYGSDTRPVDALGYMLQRLGYVGTGHEACNDPDGNRVNPYRASEQHLGMTVDQLRSFYTEIDRGGSTNATIKNMFHRLTGIPQ